jgi:hypothetical protein
MFRLLAVRTLLFTAMLFAGALLVVSLAHHGKAQEAEGQGASNSSADVYVVPKRRRPGGYSRLNLSDIWGPAEMPPPPMDFGPGFDFSPGGFTLEGVPNDSPYPN